MSNMNPEDVILSTPLDDGRDGALPPEHPAQGDATTSAGEALGLTNHQVGTTRADLGDEQR